MEQEITKQHIHVGTESYFKTLLQDISEKKYLSDCSKLFIALATIKKRSKGRKILLDTLGKVIFGDSKKARIVLEDVQDQNNIAKYAVDVIGAQDDAAEDDMIHLDHVVFLAEEKFDERVSSKVTQRFYEDLYSLTEVIAEFSVKQFRPYPKILNSASDANSSFKDESEVERQKSLERIRGKAKARFLQKRVRATLINL